MSLNDSAVTIILKILVSLFIFISAFLFLVFLLLSSYISIFLFFNKHVSKVFCCALATSIKLCSDFLCDSMSSTASSGVKFPAFTSIIKMWLSYSIKTSFSIIFLLKS